MSQKLNKKPFNARFDRRVFDAIDRIADALETTKTGAVRYAVLKTVGSSTVERLLRQKGDKTR